MKHELLTVVACDLSHRAVLTSRLDFSTRRSFLLELHTGEHVDVGEASPLSGFGDDSIEGAHSELLSLDLEFFRASLERAEASTRAPLEALFAGAAALVSPAARFAVETCLLRRWSRTVGRPAWRLLGDALGLESGSFRPLPLSTVVDPLSSDAERQVHAALGRGIRSFKLKTGRDFEGELAFARRLGSRPEAPRLRLDPNQAWSPFELERVRSEPLPLDWIEDPTSDPYEWRDAAGPLSLAIDEMLVGETPNEELLRASGADFIVLKPMALGGYSACLAWAKLARSLGLRVSVSHLFDGPVAFDATAELAQCVQTAGFAPGLGPHAGLEAWSTVPRSLGKDALLPFEESAE